MLLPDRELSLLQRSQQAAIANVREPGIKRTNIRQQAAQRQHRIIDFISFVKTVNCQHAVKRRLRKRQRLLAIIKNMPVHIKTRKLPQRRNLIKPCNRSNTSLGKMLTQQRQISRAVNEQPMPRFRHA